MVPVLVMLVVVVADFGRIFATGVLLEAAARNAAEATANEYLANPPGPLTAPAPVGDPNYYDPLHLIGARAACAELSELPNTTFSAPDCPDMPVIQVCVHDDQDTSCGYPPFAGSSAPPVECTDLTTPPSNTKPGAERWVEVRICYRFSAILNLPLLSFGDIWLQRTRNFVIPCYFGTGTTDPCGRSGAGEIGGRGAAEARRSSSSRSSFRCSAAGADRGSSCWALRVLQPADRRTRRARRPATRRSTATPRSAPRSPGSTPQVEQVDSYFRCDPPELGWPEMTKAARSNVWGMPLRPGHPRRLLVRLRRSENNYDALPVAPNVFTDCTIDTSTRGQALGCRLSGARDPAKRNAGDAKADGDDKASAIAAAVGNNSRIPRRSPSMRASVAPPISGFLLVPSQITIRAVVTEALQRQQ